MIELQMTIGNNATISFKSHLCKYKTAPYQQWSRAFKLQNAKDQWRSFASEVGGGHYHYDMQV